VATEAEADRAADTLKRLTDAVGRVVVGQRELVEGLLVALLCEGHVLVEGVPGLAKTTAIRSLAAALGLPFGRVQFTPDLLPGDLTGTPVFVPARGEFEHRPGPIFTSVLLADEINRAPAKVQSALLEAMEEQQVTVGDRTLHLPDPFFVMATQNPVELEGTYPLPEAQVDRFLLKLRVPYPSAEEERAVVARDAEPPARIEPVTDAEGVAALRAALRGVHVADEVSGYAVDLVRATRGTAALLVGQDRDARERPRRRRSPHDAERAERRRLLDGEPLALGASPRGSIALVRAARARALLEGRRFATPSDVKRAAPDVLRHRVTLSYEAEADGHTPDDVLEALLASVETP